MRILATILIALVAGFIGGIILSEIIAIIGYVGFDRLVGIKFLPFYTAIASAIIAPFVTTALKRRARS